MKTPDHDRQKAYVFNVDLLIEEDSNVKALQKLLQALNQPPFTDYKIQSGIEFGRLIDQIGQESREKSPVNVPSKLAVKQPGSKPAAAPEKPAAAAPRTAKSAAATQPPAPVYIVERIKQFIDGNTLIRLNVNKGRGIKLSVPCRIVGFDEAAQMLNVYHVDEKKVYSFSLNEIDDFVE